MQGSIFFGGSKISGSKFVVGQNISFVKIPNFLGGLTCFGGRNFLGSKNFDCQHFFGGKHFLGDKTKSYYNLIIYIREMYRKT